MEVVWDLKGEGFVCDECPDETRVMRFCTRGLREPEMWMGLTEGDYRPGEPPEPDLLCPVLRIPWWAAEVVSDVPLLRSGGVGLLQQPHWWYVLVNHADRLSRKAEAEKIKEEQKKAKGSAGGGW